MPDPRSTLDEAVRREKLGELERAIDRYRAAAVQGDAVGDAPLTAEALCRLSTVHRHRCEWDEALDSARRSALVAGRAGLPAMRAEALNAEAAVHLARGAFAEARPILEEILTVTDDPRVRGLALQNLGSVAAQTGHLGAAERYFGESYGYFRKAGYRKGEAFALNNVGRVALDRGDVQLAASVLKKAVAIADTVEDPDLVALTTLNYAETLARSGDLERAEDLVSTALGYFALAGNRYREIECLRLLAHINRVQGDTADAASCLVRALGIAEAIGALGEIASIRAAMAAG
jgi:tetratricopeptide (TPR) repeat protein